MEQEDQEPNLVILEPQTPNLNKSFLGHEARPELKEEVFYFWYNNRRMSIRKFYEKLQEEYPDEPLPSVNTIQFWIREFLPRARDLDLQVHQQLEATVIAEKVEMLKRHAKVGLRMQNLSLDYLEAHADDLTSAGAVRLLVEGIRIERESKGVPEALEKMSKMSDEQLLEEVKKLATSSSVTLERWDADS